MATISNLFVDAGSDFNNVVTVAAANGGPLNLSGYTAKAQMRKSYNSSTAYDFNATIYNAVGGQVRLQLLAADSSLIPPGRWLYDLEITSAQGDKKRVVEGIVTITPQITRS